MTLNAKLGNDFERLSEECGSEHLWEKQLWTPMKMIAPNAYGKNGFEGLWLKMPMKEMVLNA